MFWLHQYRPEAGDFAIGGCARPCVGTKEADRNLSQSQMQILLRGEIKNRSCQSRRFVYGTCFHGPDQNVQLWFGTNQEARILPQPLIDEQGCHSAACKAVCEF